MGEVPLLYPWPKGDYVNLGTGLREAGPGLLESSREP